MKLLEFSERFPDEESCRHYLKDQREKFGIECKHCGCHHHYWDKSNNRWVCAKCGSGTTLTSGTVMHGSKLPLLYWFTAIHLLTSTKKTFSALEMQHQLGHKRYQPIWEMMHKLRSVMGMRDDRYSLSGSIELDEAFFTSENSDIEKKNEKLKAGAGSQRKSKVLVMIESTPIDDGEKKKGKKDRKPGHLKMKVLSNLKADTISEKAEEAISDTGKIIADKSKSHTGIDGKFKETKTVVIPPEQAAKILPWVHTAISNAKSQLLDMYHGIKDEFLQNYLNEFCWKFNRRRFSEHLFDRLMVSSVSHVPTFKHRVYGNINTPSCG